MLHLNAHGFDNKMVQLKFLLAEHETKFSCIAISKTRFNDSTNAAQFSSVANHKPGGGITV